MDCLHACACLFNHEIAGCLLRRIANQQGFEAAILVGHSYGGNVAVLTLALLEVIGSRVAFAFLSVPRGWYPKGIILNLGGGILSDCVRLNKQARFRGRYWAGQLWSLGVTPRAKQLTSVFELEVSA